METKKRESKILLLNRRAPFDYHIERELTCGIVLTGAEVRACRDGHGALSSAYCYVDTDGQLKITGMLLHIPTGESAFDKFQSNDTRVLLARKREIEKIRKDTEDPGWTCVPLRVIRNEKNLIKVVVGICKGKKSYDKRETLKEKDHERQMDRARKNFE